MQLYLMVYAPSGNTTVMQSRPLYIAVDAPPAGFNWGESSRDVTPPQTEAKPRCMKRVIAGRTLYEFGPADSMAIWTEARKYDPRNINESH